jgi:Flp pilus assembly protein TadG
MTLAMKHGRIKPIYKRNAGQSLMETALLLPVLLTLVLNAVNVGYLFYVEVNLAAAPRSGAEYSIQGTNQSAVPPADSVYALVNESASGAVPAAAGSPVQVCTMSYGINNPGTSTQSAQCKSYNSAAATLCPIASPNHDPEAPSLVAQCVDIYYTTSPLIPGTVFNILTTRTLHWQVVMRATQ